MQVNTFLITIMQFKKRGIKDYDRNYYLLIQIIFKHDGWYFDFLLLYVPTSVAQM